MSRFALVMFVVIVVGGCGAGDDGGEPGDHGAGWRALEGKELADFLGASAPVEVGQGFRRLGFLWDAAADGAIEVRTSADGVAWSAWSAPTVITHEDIAYGGHVDAIAAGPEGSGEGDPVARWYQLRVGVGTAGPSFLVIEPLADIPPAMDPSASVPDTMDADDATSAVFSSVLSTPIGGLRIYSRADWGARAPQCASGSQTPNRATIHHTVTPTNDTVSPQARLRQIQAFHMFTNGWCDIGYNHLVSRDGRVWRGRGAATIGAHVANHNTGNNGISFMGTYTSTAPNADQMCSAAKLLRWLHETYPVSLDRTDVKGHRQYGGTACPGDTLYGKIDLILRKARNGCSAN